MRGGLWVSPVELDQLKRHGCRFAAADAERGNPFLAATLFKGVNQRQDDAGACRSNGVAKGAGPTIHINLVVRDAVLLHGSHSDHGKGFIDLVEVHISSRPTGLGEQRGQCAHGEQW
jgi:hypothetical protein